MFFGKQAAEYRQEMLTTTVDGASGQVGSAEDDR
jgi:hypothetical protein